MPGPYANPQRHCNTGGGDRGRHTRADEATDPDSTSDDTAHRDAAPDIGPGVHPDASLAAYSHSMVGGYA